MTITVIVEDLSNSVQRSFLGVNRGFLSTCSRHSKGIDHSWCENCRHKRCADKERRDVHDFRVKAD